MGTRATYKITYNDKDYNDVLIHSQDDNYLSGIAQKIVKAIKCQHDKFFTGFYDDKELPAFNFSFENAFLFASGNSTRFNLSNIGENFIDCEFIIDKERNTPSKVIHIFYDKTPISYRIDEFLQYCYDQYIFSEFLDSKYIFHKKFGLLSKSICEHIISKIETYISTREYEKESLSKVIKQIKSIMKKELKEDVRNTYVINNDVAY